MERQELEAVERVGRYRRLAAEDPAHLPGLALALSGLGSQLAFAGRRQDAVETIQEAVGIFRTLAAAEESVRIYQPLAERSPEGFDWYLSSARHTRDMALDAVGRGPEDS